MTIENDFPIQLVWLPSRDTRPQHPRSNFYAVTAGFSEPVYGHHFSVLLERVVAGSTYWRMRLLVPDRLQEVLERLTPGTKLEIFEGPHVIAYAEIHTRETLREIELATSTVA